MAIDPERLPYRDAVIASSQRGPMIIQGALTAGSAQWPKAFVQRGGRISDSEGILALTEDGVIFLSDSGNDTGWRYEEIIGYSVRKSVLGSMQKVTLRGSDWTATMRVNSQVAANADYILARKVGRSR
jgi:hypothetical protein